MWAGALGACQSDGADDQAELQALLHDEALQQVPPGVARQLPGETRAVSSAAGAAVAVASGPPVGAWTFDDCSPDHTQLRDSTNAQNTAFRSVNAACADGVQGQGVAIAATEDIVYVPDQPSFTFEGGVTVGGWFEPAATTGTRTLIRKRDRDTSSFALVLADGRFQFVASLGNGRAARLVAPARAKVGVFQHVAATYDGADLRLYVDGADVAHRHVAGTIPVGAGPLLVGNDGSERRFHGTIDGVTFATHALNADEVLQLTCLSQPPTVSVQSEPLSAPAGRPVSFDIAFTNHNPPGACAPIVFDVTLFDTGLLLDPPPQVVTPSAPVASGQTGHMTVTATAPVSTDAGATLDATFLVTEATTSFFAFDAVRFVVAASPGCQVSTSHELMVTSPSVVDDPARTAFNPTSSDPSNGAWTFKRLMENMAPAAEDAPAMVEAMLGSFTAPQVINGFSVAARPGMQTRVLARWPRTADGKLDLARAPLRLQAIVNRFDLRNLAAGDAGEGRFVFAFNDAIGLPLEATMILEYKLPAATDQDVLGWAHAFHALGALPFGSDYNAALQAITDRFTGRGVRPGHPNASAINAVRTNEIDLGDNGIWELRQFGLSPVTGMLGPVAVDLTTDGSFNNTATLASYINANQAAIIAETHTVPAAFAGQPFEAGAIFNDLSTWFAPGTDPSARHHFALNTCNGCHSEQETGTVFLQISPRSPGTEATLSGFLTGTIIADPVTAEPRVFDDLGRRKLDLQAIVCPGASARTASLRKGISRVH